MKINQIRPLEAKFTEVLSGIALMPKMLYYYGKIPEKRVKTVAIVGARKNTEYGYKVAYEAAYGLAKRGVLIISGLALGIDSIAHRGALDAGGVTIGVLGTPITKMYPRRHAGLAQEMIEKGGAVMSEYTEETEMDWRASFLHRNRIISGLADVVIVAEAEEKSGSLNTAMHAIEQGREVFAVPGDIDRATSRGCNRLIVQGAQPYTGVEDVLETLGIASGRAGNLGCPGGSKGGSSGFGALGLSGGGRKRSRLISGDTELETAVLREISRGTRDGEELVEKLEVEVAEFNQVITLLEIKGRVRALGANKWALLG